jgi:hypothetical protein
MLDIDTNWQYCGLRVVRIENDWLSIDVLPELGAKIYHFVHKKSGRDLLWHNPRLLPERVPFGASFDDHWSGGWDELLPNDLPRPALAGDILPDHGEFWSQQSEWQIASASPTSVEVRFSLNGRVLPTRFEKTILIAANEPFARIHYSFSNAGPSDFPFLWNIHPAMAISTHTWLDVPAQKGITDPWREEQFVGNTTFQWPYAIDRQGREIDLRRVEPPEAGTADMHYLIEIDEGWYAVTDQAAQVGFALSFPKAVFPHIWLFRTFGGWRGLHTLILEASTGYPYDLEVAARNGTCRILAAHETLDVEVLAIPYAGVKSVAGIRSNGEIIPSPAK